MLKVKNYSLFITLSLIIITPLLFAQDNWNKEFTKEGITVYTRPVEGSALKEFMGETLINAPMKVCLNVIDDIENQTKWRPDCIVAKLVKKDADSTIAYFENKTPWPVSNRDVIVKTIVSISEEKVVLNFSALDDPGLVPLKNGIVRMTELTGMWILIPKGNETVVTYQAKINPAGSIPDFLANKTSKEQPYKSLLGLKEMVKDPKYRTD